MQVYDTLNGKIYEKKDLIKESYEVFLKDLHLEDGFDNEKDMKKEAMNTAKEYVKENAIPLSQVKKWKKENQ